MFGRLRRTITLCDAAAGILFFGLLAGRDDLQSAALQAARELQARGYASFSDAQPLRIYPLESTARGEANQAGAWRPGLVALRPQPAGAHSAAVYLRHELMHESTHRTCGGKLAPWAEEAAAIAFSGEAVDDGSVIAGELERLREAVRLDTPLDTMSYRFLVRLVAQHGWPEAACAVSPALSAMLTPYRQNQQPLAYVVINMISGRVMESDGDIDSRWPPGSLLKIPYAAALDLDHPEDLGRILARSDTAALVQLRAAWQREKYGLLLAGIAVEPRLDLMAAEITPGANAGVPAQAANLAEPQAQWRVLLGERSADGTFPIRASMVELSHMLRAALLLTPERFAALQHNGEWADSTLAAADAQARSQLRRMHALAKTGTVANARGEPLIGHLMLAWPAEQPEYLAVLRRGGTRGAGVLEAAGTLLQRWQRDYVPGNAEVRVRLFALLDATEIDVSSACPTLEVTRQATRYRSSVCGELRLHTAAPGARPERRVSGLLQRSADGWLLLTDPDSYADGVLDAEAADLQGEARQALRAVIMWDGLHGARRHADSHSVCDTTHCMVFRGAPPAPAAPRGRAVTAQLAWLDTLSRAAHLDWLQFSKGGSTPWSRDVADEVLAKQLKESLVLGVSRERTRSGEVVFHLTYAHGSEVVGCDALRKALQLPSCPARVAHQGNLWRFEGVGEGHGVGLNVERARTLSSEGRSALEILQDAYGQR